MKKIYKDKLKATSIHLCMSLIIAIVCYLLVSQLWYPHPLLKATGVWSIFIMMMVIDLLIGPLLTFVVYKKPKKTLKTDLFIIAILQISAITYGMYSIYQGRPAWVSFVLDRFELVKANEMVIDEKYNIRAKKNGLSYHYVDFKLKSGEDRLTSFIQETQLGVGPAQRPALYRNYEQGFKEITKASIPLNVLNKYNSNKKVNQIIKQYPKADAFLPLKTTHEDMSVLINTKDKAKVVAIVDLRPWS